MDLNFDSRSQKCAKVKTFVSIISKSFQSILMLFGILLRHVGVTTLIATLSRPSDIQARKSYLCDFVKKASQKNKNKKKTLNVGLYSGT